MIAPARIEPDTRPELLDLFETLSSASFDLKAVAEHLYVWRDSGADHTRQFASARAAAERVLLALSEWEG